MNLAQVKYFLAAKGFRKTLSVLDEDVALVKQNEDSGIRRRGGNSQVCIQH